MRYSFLAFVLCFVNSLSVFSQQAGDSSLFLYQDFISLVRAYHPVVAQTNLRLQMADQQIMGTRGTLDPKLYSDFNNKEFDGTNYYNKWKSGLKIPTWFGADFKVGYEQNTGAYLNPENTIPVDGQLELGVSVPLLQNLVYNDRRVAIKQAQLLQQSTLQEQRLVVNDLLFEATKVYWFWVESYALLQVHLESVKTAEIRFNAVKSNYINGYKPAIDTLEALIQVQNRSFNVQEAEVNYANAGLMLSNYLWYENSTPLELQPSLTPPLPQQAQLPVLANDSLQKVVAVASIVHPEINQLKIAVTSQELQRRLYANNLLPDLSVDYTLLSGNASSWENASQDFGFGNYKLGVSFVMPLFLRKERSYLNSMQLKTDETSLKLGLKEREISNKINASYNKYVTLGTQLVLYKRTVQNYQDLYLAELRMFNMGESTLFLVNSREQKTIEAKLKLAELLSKYQSAFQAIWWSGGLLE